jgi:hypothetical protein
MSGMNNYAQFEVSIFRLEGAGEPQVEQLRYAIERAVQDMYPDRSNGNQVFVEIVERPSSGEVAQAEESVSPSDASNSFELLLREYDDAVAAAERDDELVPEHHTVAKFGQVVSDARNALKRFVMR